ncbi:MAG: hypothetical protein Q9184_006666 [Pyrenodesmia sp. 2 TL-2023]
MRNHDKALANSVVEPVITFMRAQTDKTRLEITELDRYLEYREHDVGKGWRAMVKRAQTGHREGAALCSAVKVMAESAGVDFAASKRILWPMIREWELVHEELAAQVEKHPAYNERLREYIVGLQYQMSGNEIWSRTTLRYKVKS